MLGVQKGCQDEVNVKGVEKVDRKKDWPSALLKPNGDGLAGYLTEVEESLELLETECDLTRLCPDRILLKVSRIDGEFSVQDLACLASLVFINKAPDLEHFLSDLERDLIESAVEVLNNVDEKSGP